MAFASVLTEPGADRRPAPGSLPFSRTCGESGESAVPKPLWLVTMPTRSRHGAPGSQTFAVRADSPHAAVARAREAARTDAAVLRRRAAHIDLAAATAVRH
ncbi:hypothetical protein [Kitasatospora sp. NPDC088134]|uniref:hypothetical protein n=1 Tax=Kitasatospora sp. NPDC088134 TaxID=3364071 RepID=UPI003823F6F3